MPTLHLRFFGTPHATLDAKPIKISAETMAEHEIQPWQEFPLYVPMPGYEGFHHFSIDKAVANGLTFRPIEDTIRDILDWYPPEQALRTGMKAEREAELIKKLS